MGLCLQHPEPCRLVRASFLLSSKQQAKMVDPMEMGWGCPRNISHIGDVVQATLVASSPGSSVWWPLHMQERFCFFLIH